jgi:peptidyl-prolyl cis-trans isomerase C
MRLFSTVAAKRAARLPRPVTSILTLAALAGLSLASSMAPAAHAQGTALATVNGKPVTEADLKMAETELGPELAQLPAASRRRILLEYVIENQIFSDAAEGAKLATGPDFDERMQYWRRRALRDLYFEKTIKASVKDEDAKKFYDEQVKAVKPEEEVKARHILVEEEAKAKEIAEKITKGGDFTALAKEFSKDPGSKENGGDLGFFSKGQMVPEFEAAAFALEKGKVSAPVKSNFGWHIIKLEDKRLREPPPFDGLKERIVNSLLQKKAQAVGGDLRAAAKIEYVDAEIKKAVETEKAAAAAQPAAPAAAPAAAPTQSKPPAKK